MGSRFYNDTLYSFLSQFEVPQPSIDNKYATLPESMLSVIKANKICIYRLISPSGKVYIGQTVNLHSRITKYKKLHCKSQPVLYSSLKKHGFFNHRLTVLRTFTEKDSREVINQQEVEFYNHFEKLGYVMLNSREPGGSKGRMSEESKELMRKAKIGVAPWNKGKKTGLIPRNKGKIYSFKSYTYTKDGGKIVVDDLRRFCQANGLAYSAMIELQSENGNYGKRGKYSGYKKYKE